MTADNQVTLEPVAWLYELLGQKLKRVHLERCNEYFKDWTETPLYTQPAINSGGEVIDDFTGRIPENGVVAIPAGLYAKVCEALAAMDRAPEVEDSRPDFVGSPQAKIEAYNQMHETAVDLGYPSILEALEALEDLSQPEPRPVEAGEVEDVREALGLALIRLEVNEPKDSRAVSDEFVAMAAVHAGITDRRADCMEIIRARVSEAAALSTDQGREGE